MKEIEKRKIEMIEEVIRNKTDKLIEIKKIREAERKEKIYRKKLV